MTNPCALLPIRLFSVDWMCTLDARERSGILLILSVKEMKVTEIRFEVWNALCLVQ